jgi:hypothetical protein
VVSRTIEGPGDGLYVSAETAARWLGVSEDTFRRLVEQQDWLHARHIGRVSLYHWMDIVALSRIICGALQHPARGGEPQKKKSDAQSRPEPPRAAQGGRPEVDP